MECVVYACQTNTLSEVRMALKPKKMQYFHQYSCCKIIGLQDNTTSKSSNLIGQVQKQNQSILGPFWAKIEFCLQ